MPSDRDEEPTADACLTLLSNAHRRAVLLSIYDREPIPVEETIPGPISASVEVSLNHNHLPKLEEHGVVRWDREAGTVAAGPTFGAIEPFIDCLDDDRGALPDDWRPGRDR